MTQRTLAEWLDWQQTAHPRPIDLGLERLANVLDRLEWRGFRCPVVTVGGTNGKGSCVAFLEAILSASGRRVGVFTSPHLVRYNERIRVDGQEVADAAIVAAFERIEAARGPQTLTFFEYNALAAFLLFEDAEVDAVVLEVGLGGRLDAVNVVAADAAVVTSIGLDHCEWLGSDLQSIGREKAGIFRSGRPAIFGARQRPTSIDTEARRIGASLWRLGDEFDYVVDGDCWRWNGPGVVLADLPRPALHGTTQYANAAAAIAALVGLRHRLPVSEQAIRSGLRNVRLPGRFQVIEGPVEWILDVAHNPDGAGTLAQHLAERPARGRTLGVCGILGDKDVAAIVGQLAGVIDDWYAAGLEGPRALAAGELAERLRVAGARIAGTAPTVALACELARADAQTGDRVVVFGSFHTVGPAIEWLERQRSAEIADGTMPRAGARADV